MAIIIFLIMLGVLVLVHEYGHYIVAKKTDTRVDEFGLGFPPRAKTLGTRGDTTFTLNWIPFGGFVKIHGDTPLADEEEDIDRGRSFMHKPRRVQALILIAGIVFNMLLAWLLFAVAFMIGVPTATNNATADTIRDAHVRVIEVRDDSPAAAADIAPGDRIESAAVAGETHQIESAEAFISLIDQYPREAIRISGMRDDAPFETVVLPRVEHDDAFLGVGVADVGIRKLGFSQAIVAGFTEVGETTREIFRVIGQFISGTGDVGTVAGPVGIVTVVGSASAQGAAHVFLLAALISVNLAIINLLPVPALDGGRLLFVAIEWLSGRRIPAKFFGWANAIGFALLILLMIVVTINDVLRLTG